MSLSELDPRSALARDRPRVAILGSRDGTSSALAEAFDRRGYDAWVADPAEPLERRPDVVLARPEALATLDGVGGLLQVRRLERRGARILNGASALLAAHDRLSSVLLLGRNGVAQPRTAHVREPRAPGFPPPYLVRPRFGVWERDVVRCDSEAELVDCLEALEHRCWFRRQGALVQTLQGAVRPTLRLVVAAGRIVGAQERLAFPSDWAADVQDGATAAPSRPVEPSLATRVLAIRAAAILGLDLAGVDIAVDGGTRQVVVEVDAATALDEGYEDGTATATADALLEEVESGERLLAIGLN